LYRKSASLRVALVGVEGVGGNTFYSFYEKALWLKISLGRRTKQRRGRRRKRRRRRRKVYSRLRRKRHRGRGVGGGGGGAWGNGAGVWW